MLFFLPLKNYLSLTAPVCVVLRCTTTEKQSCCLNKYTCYDCCYQYYNIHEQSSLHTYVYDGRPHYNNSMRERVLLCLDDVPNEAEMRHYRGVSVEIATLHSSLCSAEIYAAPICAGTLRDEQKNRRTEDQENKEQGTRTETQRTENREQRRRTEEPRVDEMRHKLLFPFG